MVRLHEAYREAQELRKRGFTYKEISHITGVSLSTVSNWVSHEPWSKDVRKRNETRAARENSKRMGILNKARSNQYKKLYAEAERSAITEYKHYKRDPLFVAGLMLYIGEGDAKNPRLIRLSGANKDAHRIFHSFVVEYLGVSRETIRFWLLLYPDLNETACIAIWKKELRFKKDQLYKTQVIASKSKKQTLQHGVGNTIIGSAVLKRKLMKWIELALKEL